MKVLLVKPEFNNVFTKLSLIITEPLELEYISSNIEPLGHKVTIVDMIIEKKKISYFLLSEFLMFFATETISLQPKSTI